MHDMHGMYDKHGMYVWHVWYVWYMWYVLCKGVWNNVIVTKESTMHTLG